jgi:hypothetical protein
VWAVIVIWMIGRVQSDMITETMMVLAPCYILYYVAQFHLQMSGVLAVTVFGLCFPWWGNTRISPGLFPYVHRISPHACFMPRIPPNCGCSCFTFSFVGVDSLIEFL